MNEKYFVINFENHLAQFLLRFFHQIKNSDLIERILLFIATNTPGSLFYDLLVILLLFSIQFFLYSLKFLVY
jgi:hypothetical protein